VGEMFGSILDAPGGSFTFQIGLCCSVSEAQCVKKIREGVREMSE